MQAFEDFLGNQSNQTFEDVVKYIPDKSTKGTRIALLSDLHANWPALSAVLEDAKDRYDTIWFLGDAIGYGPHPIECIRFLKYIVADQLCIGNHDLGVVGTLDKHLFNYKPSRHAKWAWKHHEQLLRSYDVELWDWFKKLISSQKVNPIIKHFDSLVSVFVHAIIEDPIGFSLYPNDWGNILDNLRKLEKLKCADESLALLVVGHSHMVTLAYLEQRSTSPKLERIVYGEPILLRDGAYLINPGSVGQPRDGDTRAAYAILDIAARTVEFRRVEYDFRATQISMQAEQYPQNLIERLSTGRIRDTTKFEGVYLRDTNGLVPRK